MGDIKRYDVPQHDHSELTSNQWYLNRDKVHYFISRSPGTSVPPCFNGDIAWANHCPNMPLRGWFRSVLVRYVNKDFNNDDLITFAYEAWNNAIRHGYFDENGHRAKEKWIKWPSLVIEDDSDHWIITAQDLGIGIERHKPLPPARRDWAQLGIDKIKRVASDAVFHFDGIGQLVQARMRKPK